MRLWLILTHFDISLEDFSCIHSVLVGYFMLVFVSLLGFVRFLMHTYGDAYLSDEHRNSCCYYCKLSPKQTNGGKQHKILQDTINTRCTSMYKFTSRAQFISSLWDTTNTRRLRVRTDSTTVQRLLGTRWFHYFSTFLDEGRERC